MDSMSFDSPLRGQQADGRRQLVLFVDKRTPHSGLGAILSLSFWKFQYTCMLNIEIHRIYMGWKQKHIWTHVVQDISHISPDETMQMHNISFPEKDTPLPSKIALVWSQVLSGLDHFGSRLHTKQIMSRVEASRDTNLRSLLRELRTDIAMAVDDSFPLVYGLADKSIITDQLLKVSISEPIYELFHCSPQNKSCPIWRQAYLLSPYDPEMPT